MIRLHGGSDLSCQIEIGKSVAADIAGLHEGAIAVGRSDLVRRIEAMSRSSGPRPIDSLRSSIANLNFRRWRCVRLSNLSSQYWSGNLGKKYVQAQFD
jgi:hypothetical protein